jgi:hypothetical protein
MMLLEQVVLVDLPEQPPQLQHPAVLLNLLNTAVLQHLHQVLH